MITKTMKVKQSSFRKLDDPFENGKSKKYIFYVKVDDVAEGIPMATNPREQKLTSAVAAAIQDSLLSNDGYFHLKNRGIVLSAESVHYNNAKEEVSIVFSDSLSHGDIDGGHTYKIVCLHKGEGLEQYVPFEVMTGVEDIIEQLAEARNTSVQVDQKSLAELAQRFEPIKEALEGMPFYQRIAFKQNQVSKDEETGKKLKMIDAREIVAIINMFDVESYSKSVHPTQAYSSKGKMLDTYLENPERYRKFGGRDLCYKVPDGLAYPTVAAFRALVDYDASTGKYCWKHGKDPIAVWDACKGELTTKIMNFASAIGDNPNAVGKDANIWDLAYMTVERCVEE